MDDIYKFSLTKDFIFVANHCGKIYLIVSSIIILLVVTFGRNSISLSGMIYVLSFLGILTYFVRNFLKKFAYKIIIDFPNKIVKLFMCQKQGTITANFDEIRIRINGYVIFIVHESKVFYNARQNNELFDALNKIKKIEWGNWCGLLGPDEKLRKNLDSVWTGRRHYDGTLGE